MLKKILILSTIVVLFAGSYFLLKKPEPEVSFTTVPVTRGDIMQTVSATGTIQAVNTVDVGTQVSGTINRIFVDYNSPVEEGQVIATIDPTLFLAEVNRAKADLAAAKAGVAESQADLNEANRDHKRKKTLFEKDFIAESELDTALTTVETSRARLQSAKASVQQAQASLDKAQANLNYTTITAPLDGVVVGRDVSEGQTVAASYSTPTLFTIAEDLTKMQVEADVDEADIGYVKDGMKVTFSVDTYPEDTFQGYVHQVRLQPQTVENVVTYTVIIRVENPEMKLKPGMTANVDIEVASAKDVLKVPAAAFRFSPPAAHSEEGQAHARNRFPGPVIWLREEDGDRPMKPVPVQVGLTDNSFTEISGDVREGQPVITGMSGQGGKKPQRRGMF